MSAVTLFNVPGGSSTVAMLEGERTLLFKLGFGRQRQYWSPEVKFPSRRMEVLGGGTRGLVPREGR